MSRTPQRLQFLQDVLTTAIEGGVNYWATVTEYRWEHLPVGDAFAVLFDTEGDNEKHRVDVDVVAKGIGVLTGARTGDRWKGTYWQQFVAANRTNGDQGDYDADIADQIVQAGLFGEVVYG